MTRLMYIELPDKKYFSISEVSKLFNVNNSLLRFWEKEFDLLNPKVKPSGIRKFTKDDIEVELTEGTLTVRSAIKKDDDGGDNDEVSSNNEIGFVHRGIAKRAFARSFQLSDDIIVKDADLADGMLIVNLERVIPDEKKPRLIPIGR